MNETLKTWSVLEILKVTEKAFAEKGIVNPRLNAELLLSDTTGESRMELYLNFDKPLSQSEVSAYRDKVKRRLKYEPLQYILGKTEFYSLNFKVTNDVLIPRQETELLVDLVLEHIKHISPVTPKILEIGAGSGCVSIAIAANTECLIDSIDISSEALKIAEDNSVFNNTSNKIKFIQKDFLNLADTFEGYDIVVSNPPYISAADIEGLSEEVKNYEPLTALTDNDDGLTFYKKIFELSKKPNSNAAVFLELGDGKSEAIINLLKGYGITNYSIHNDLINIPRVLKIEGKS